MAIKDLKDEIGGLKRDLDLSTDALAGALKVDSRTVERWRTGASFPQRDGRERLEALMNVRNHVLDTFATAEAARAWMHASNRYRPDPPIGEHQFSSRGCSSRPRRIAPAGGESSGRCCSSRSSPSPRGQRSAPATCATSSGVARVPPALVLTLSTGRLKLEFPGNFVHTDGGQVVFAVEYVWMKIAEISFLVAVANSSPLLKQFMPYFGL